MRGLWPPPSSALSVQFFPFRGVPPIGWPSRTKRFLSWCEGQGVELPGVTPGMVGQYLVGLGGSAAKRNLHLSALWGFFDRLVNRHVVILNPAASVPDGVGDVLVAGSWPTTRPCQISGAMTGDMLRSSLAASCLRARRKAINARTIEENPVSSTETNNNPMLPMMTPNAVAFRPPTMPKHAARYSLRSCLSCSSASCTSDR
jgi:hypothetical protein